MNEISPFKLFFNWLFDENLKTEIPDKQKMLKYNSPITTTFIMKVFLRSGELNHYLNTYINNINLRYLDKEEFFKFIKKCVIDFKVKRKDIVYYQYKRKDILFDKLRTKMTILKNDDLDFLCDIIDKSDEKESIYNALGINKPVKSKKKKSKQKNISSKEFIEDNFAIVEI
jgi:hypothetical protein